MSECRRCGASIRWVTVEQTGERIAIDGMPSLGGSDRYRETSFNPPKVEPVAPNASVAGYRKHDCLVTAA